MKFERDVVAMVETNVDDVSGEILGRAVERLMQEGAFDATVSPYLGKKGRMGHTVRALCACDAVEKIAQIMVEETGMTRMDLLAKNAGIIKSVTQEVAKHAPDSKLIMVTNPLDAMTYVALKSTGFKKGRVFGMSGMLDLSRFKQLLSEALHASRASINALVIGEHGESMTPLPSYTSVNGIPLKSLLTEAQIDEAIEKTRKVAAEVIAKKGATFYAPANGVARMVEAVRYDKKALIPVSTYLEGEYGVSGICIGVPAIIGAEGVEKIIQVPLSGKEKESFDKGAATLKEAVASIQL